MKSIPSTEAESRLDSVLDEVQREPVVIRKQDRDVAIVLSMSEYERLRKGNLHAFVEFRNQLAVQAKAKGLTEQRLAELLANDES